MITFLDIILLLGLVLAALWTVMTIRLIRSVVGLALTSAILSVMLYRLDSPFAAVFELSVCSGLISVIFITTVSFTHRVSKEMLVSRAKERMLKFWYLPIVLAAVCLFLLRFMSVPKIALPAAGAAQDVRDLLWNFRHLDILGQIVVLLAGAFGVVVFFKETRNEP